MTRLLLIALLLVAPLQNARSQADVNPFQSYGHTFDDLLDAVRALRKKTNQAAFFWLEMPRYPEAPVFTPDAAGEAFFVLPVAMAFSKDLPPKELEAELARLRHAARFAATYDRQRRRVTYYPPEAVAELRRSLAPWLLTAKEVAERPYLRQGDVVAARIPRDREEEFLDALLTGFLHSNRKEFRCSVGWN